MIICIISGKSHTTLALFLTIPTQLAPLCRKLISNAKPKQKARPDNPNTQIKKKQGIKIIKAKT